MLDMGRLNLSPSNKKRAVVVGGAGFVGSHVTDALARLTGDPLQEVFVVGRTEPAVGLPATFVAGNRKEPGFVRDLISDLRPSFWFDMAVFDEDAMNALVQAHLAEPSLKAAVIAGTIAEYGPGGDLPLPLSEDLPLRPEGRYGRGKAAAWRAARTAFEQNSVPVIWAVLPQLWGPRDPHGRDCHFVRQLLTGETITLRGNGRTVIPDGYVETAAEALVHLGLNPATVVGRRVNVCGHALLTPLRYIQWAADALGVRSNIAYGDHRTMQAAEASTGKKYRPVFGDYDFALDTGRLSGAGFKQVIGAPEGVRRTALWHRDNQSEPAPYFAQSFTLPKGDM